MHGDVRVVPRHLTSPLTAYVAGWFSVRVCPAGFFINKTSVVNSLDEINTYDWHRLSYGPWDRPCNTGFACKSMKQQLRRPGGALCGFRGCDGPLTNYFTVVKNILLTRCKSCCIYPSLFEPLAQSVEHLTFNQVVVGSIPTRLTTTHVPFV